MNYDEAIGRIDSVLNSLDTALVEILSDDVPLFVAIEPFKSYLDCCGAVSGILDLRMHYMQKKYEQELAD